MTFVYRFVLRELGVGRFTLDNGIRWYHQLRRQKKKNEGGRSSVRIVRVAVGERNTAKSRGFYADRKSPPVITILNLLPNLYASYTEFFLSSSKVTSRKEQFLPMPRDKIFDMNVYRKVTESENFRTDWMFLFTVKLSQRSTYFYVVCLHW